MTTLWNQFTHPSVIFVLFWLRVAPWEVEQGGRAKYLSCLQSPETCCLYGWLCLLYRLIIVLKRSVHWNPHFVPFREGENISISAWPFHSASVYEIEWEAQSVRETPISRRVTACLLCPKITRGAAAVVEAARPSKALTLLPKSPVKGYLYSCGWVTNKIHNCVSRDQW